MASWSFRARDAANGHERTGPTGAGASGVPSRSRRASPDLRPYRLRGSFVSLLLWEGRSLTYVAEEAGHSVATLPRHYAGTMRELETKPRVPAAEAIRQAREDVCGTHSGRTPQIVDDRKEVNPLLLPEWAILGSNQ